MAIRWEHLHSYNPQKCFNDHHGRRLGDKRSKWFHMKSHFLWASSCSRYQTTAKVDKITKQKQEKKLNSSLSSRLTKPTVRIRAGVAQSPVQSAPAPLFLDFNALEKKLSFHEYSTSTLKQNSFIMNIKKHQMFHRLWDMMISLGGRVPVNGRAPPDQ